jgi:hypothetical protein
MTRLNSELPIEELVKLSRSLNERRFMDVFNMHRRGSFVLNKNIPPHRNPYAFMDIEGARAGLAKYADYRVAEGSLAPLGILAKAETQLRNLWKGVEHQHKINGRDQATLPSGKDHIGQKIVSAAALFKISFEEYRALKKFVEEHDQRVKEEREAKRSNPRYRIGSHKRNSNGAIIKVDGMDVDPTTGKIIETGQDAEQYLAEVRAERKARKARASA